MKHKLLEYIYEKSNFTYLSDLRSPENLATLIPLLKDVDESMYTLDEWDQFISYVVGKQVYAQSIKEAIQILKNYTDA